MDATDSTIHMMNYDAIAEKFISCVIARRCSTIFEIWEKMEHDDSK